MPLKNPTSIKIREPDDDKAARASGPRKFPTIRVSAALYSCWKRFPRKRGNANAMIFAETEPVEKSTVDDEADMARGIISIGKGESRQTGT